MSMKEATVVEWKYNEGDHVAEGDVVLIIETEKTTWEVEALDSGYLHVLIAADPDAREPVGKVVGQLAETEEELKTLQAESGVVDVPAAESSEKPAAPKKTAAGKESKGGRVRVSPVAKKMAAEHGLDLGAVSGSGPGGRITKKDVEAAIEEKKTSPQGPAAGDPESPYELVDGKRVKSTVSIKYGMRKAIAAHMTQSLAVSAQLTSMGEVDMTEMIKLRGELLKQEESLQTRVTYTDLFVLAVTRTLQDVPFVNSSIVGDEIVLWEDINIGVAVALEGTPLTGGGLLVPVLRDADQKSLSEISKELKGLIKNCREGNILPDDLQGGTFTITNIGGIASGYSFATPIINQPQSGILGTGSIADRAVVRDGEIVIRPIMAISFTFDHRIIDGALAGQFAGRLSQLLEYPALMLCR